MKFLAFDIETAKITPDGEDIQSHRPLGICCWAIAWSEDGKTLTKAYSGTDSEGGITPQLSRRECEGVVEMLQSAADRGFVIVAHNGTGFDFDILAEESGMHAACKDLAMQSIDTCLLVHCLKGFPVGLEAIANGMGLQGKTEGMTGALAPQMWAEGRYEEVLAYVEQDVRSTLSVALAIERERRLGWVARSGKRNYMAVPLLLTVAEALRLPEPNTSWMTDPMPRSRFTGWMK